MTLLHLSFPLRPFASVSWLDAVWPRGTCSFLFVWEDLIAITTDVFSTRVRQCDIITNNSKIGSVPRYLRTCHGEQIAHSSHVHREVVVEQTCHFSERNGLYLHHFVLIYENSPLTSTFTVNQCAAETRAAGTAVSPLHPAHWLQKDTQRLSCFLDSRMQPEPKETRNGSRVGTFTCRYLT